MTFIGRSRILSLFAAAIVAGCGGESSSEPAPTGPSGGQSFDAGLFPLETDDEIVVERYPEGAYDFEDRGHSSGFAEAVQSLQRESGARLAPVDGITGAIGLRVDHELADKELDDWQKDRAAAGAYVVRYDNTFGYGGDDALLVLPTRDQFEVVRAVGTNGLNYDISNRDVLRWLRELNRTHPFRLNEAGLDYVAGWFLEPVPDADALAKRMYEFCPDIVDQGTDTVPALARELERTQYLYLWWD